MNDSPYILDIRLFVCETALSRPSCRSTAEKDVINRSLQAIYLRKTAKSVYLSKEVDAFCGFLKISSGRCCYSSTVGRGSDNHCERDAHGLRLP